MPVGVVRAHRDQRDPGAAGREEVRIGVAAAVVRHLEHVGPQVDPGGDHRASASGPQVAGEQDPQPVDRDPDDHRQVVRRGPRGARSGAGRAPRRDVPDRAPVAGHQDAASRRHGARARRTRRPGRRPATGAGRHHPDVPAGQRSGQTADVVGVQVGQQDQRQRRRCRAGPGTGRPRRRRGRRPRAPRPPARWAARSASPCPTSQATTTVSAGGHPARLPERPAQHDEPDQRGQRQRAQPGNRQSAHAPDQQQDGQQDGSAGPGRPARRRVRHVAARSATDHEPADRPAGQPDQRVATGGTPPTTGRQQAEHGGRRDRRRGQQVGRQRDQADRAVRAATIGAVTRPAAALTASGVGERPASTALPEAPRPARREQDDRRRWPPPTARSRRPGQPRVEQSRTQTAAPRAGTAARGRPEASARSVTAPMAAARTTLGLGRARTTKPTSASPATTACTRRSTARRRSGQRTPASTMATFAPDTAVRCARPARPKSSSSTGSMARVSPTTRPGSRPAGPGSRTRSAPSPRAPAAALRRPAAQPRARRPAWAARARRPPRRRRPPAGARETDADADLLARGQAYPPVARREEQHAGVGAGGSLARRPGGDRGIRHDPRWPRPPQHVRVAVQLEDDRRRATRLGDRRAAATPPAPLLGPPRSPRRPPARQHGQDDGGAGRRSTGGRGPRATPRPARPSRARRR